MNKIKNLDFIARYILLEKQRINVLTDFGPLSDHYLNLIDVQDHLRYTVTTSEADELDRFLGNSNEKNLTK